MGLRAWLDLDPWGTRLEVLRLEATEALCTWTDLRVTIHDAEANLDTEAVIWQPALTEVAEQDPAEAEQFPPSFFHGVVEEASYLRPYERGHLYQLRLRPQTHGLKYRRRSRIFQHQSVVDIIKQVLSEAGIPEDTAQWDTRGDYVPREYTTQWRESELAFVQRLLEDHGIYWWVEHSEQGHVVRFVDDPAIHAPIEGDPILPVSNARARADRRELLHSLHITHQLTHNAYFARDYNFESPSTPVEGSAQEQEGAGFEYYQHPTRAPRSDQASRQADDRLRAALAQRIVLRGRATSRRLRPGALFQVASAHPPELNDEYLVIQVDHHFADPRYAHEQGEQSGFWETAFEAIPAAVPYRPALRTPRPVACGMHTAVVTGPSGEEIHVDRFGRIKVHFYWDREGPHDERSSCWIRVQQLNTATTMVLPRVGWEVGIAFLYGDPDRPVCLGKLYNNEAMPPYALPASLAQSALQSLSTPGGSGSNEIRMDDSNGAMEWFLHAQRDYATTIGNDRTEEIIVNSSLQVGNDCTSTVGGDETVEIGQEQRVSVRGTFVDETVGSRTVTVGGLDDWGTGSLLTVGVKGSRAETIGNTMAVLAQSIAEEFQSNNDRSVGGVQLFAAGGAFTDTTSGDKMEVVAGAKLELIERAKAENIGAAKVLNAGAVRFQTGEDIQCSTDGALALTTGGPIAIKCGEDFAISGKTVTCTIGKLTLNAGGKITANPGKVRVKAGNVQGAGSTLKLKGQVEYTK